ncbi:MAG: hypothetical protein O2857_21120, partial [Planctomycetota bacterium]|nr:hypothetical protein [Planctomycetota bacterium]
MSENTLTPEVQKLLNKVKAREHRLRHIKGLFLFMLALCAITVAGALFDRFVPATRDTRWMVAWAAYLLSVGCLFLLWLLPARKAISNVEAAWLVERGVGKLDEKLVSTVELSEHEDEFDFLSLPMIRELAKSTAVDASSVQIDRVSPLSKVKKPAMALAGVAVVFLIMAAVPQISLHRLSARFWYPSVRYGRIGSFQLEVMNAVKDRVALGEAYDFHIHATSPDVESVFLNINLANGEQRAKEIFKGEDGDFRFAFEDTRDSFTYQASAHHVSTDILGVSVLPRPRVEEFVKIIDWPEYTGRLTTREISSTGDLEALPGSRGKVVIRTSAASQGFIIIGEERKELARIEDKDGLSFVYEFEFTAHKYRLEFISTEGMSSKENTEYSIAQISDTNPTIQLLGLSDNQALFDAGVMKLRFRAEDDFGLAQVSVVYSVNGSPTRETIIREGIKAGQSTQLDDSYEWNFGEITTADASIDFSLMVVDHSGRSGRTHSIFVSRRDKLVTREEQSLAQRTDDSSKTSTRIAADLKRLKEIQEELSHSDERQAKALLREENILANRVAEDFKKLIRTLASAEGMAVDSPREFLLNSLRESAESVARIEFPEFELSRGVKNVLVQNHDPAIAAYVRELNRMSAVAVQLDQAVGSLDAEVRSETIAKQLNNQISRYENIVKAQKSVDTPEARDRLTRRCIEAIRSMAPIAAESHILAQRDQGYGYLAQFKRLDEEVRKVMAELIREPQKMPGTGWFSHARDVQDHRLPHLTKSFTAQVTKVAELLARARPSLKTEFASLARGLDMLKKAKAELLPLEARVRQLTSKDGLVLRMLNHPEGVQRSESYDALKREFANRTELWSGIVDTVNLKANPFTNQQSNFLIAYEGWVYIREPGAYTFGLIADDCAYLRVDDRVIHGIDSCPPYPLEVIPADAPIELNIGRHPIELLFSQGIGAAVLSLHWKKPGGDEFTLVPADAFTAQGRENREDTQLQRLARKLLDAHHKAVTLKKTELQQKLSLIAESFDLESRKLKLEGEEIIQPRADLIMMSGVLGSIRHLLDGTKVRGDAKPDTPPDVALSTVADAEPMLEYQRDLERILYTVDQGLLLATHYQNDSRIPRDERHKGMSRLHTRLDKSLKYSGELQRLPQWDTDSQRSLQQIAGELAASVRHSEQYTQGGDSNEASQIKALLTKLPLIKAEATKVRDALSLRNLPHRDRLGEILPTASQQIYASSGELIEADKHIKVTRNKEVTEDLAYGVLENAPEGMKRMIAVEQELENISIRLRADALGEIARKAPDVEKASIQASAALALDKVRKSDLDRTMNQLDMAFSTASIATGESTDEDKKMDTLLVNVLNGDEKTRFKLEQIAGLLEQIEKGMRGEISDGEFLAARDKLHDLAGDKGRSFQRLTDSMRAKRELDQLNADLIKANAKGGQERQEHFARTAEESGKLKQDLARRTPGSELMKEELKNLAIRQLNADNAKLAQLNSEPDPRKRDEAEANLFQPYKPLIEKLGLDADGKFAKQPISTKLNALSAEVKKLDTDKIDLPQQLTRVAVSDVTTELDRKLPIEQIRNAARTADQLASRAADLDKKEMDFEAAKSSLQAAIPKAQNQALAENEKHAQELSKALGAELDNNERTQALSDLNNIQRPLREQGMDGLQTASAARQAAAMYRQAAQSLQPLVEKSDKENQPGLQAMQESLKNEAGRLEEQAKALAADANELQQAQNSINAQRQEVAQQTGQARGQAESVAGAIEARDADVRTQALRSLAQQMNEAAADRGQTALPEVQPLASNLRDRLNEIADQAEQPGAPQEALAMLQKPIETLAEAIQPQAGSEQAQPQAAAASSEVREALRPISQKLAQVEAASDAIKRTAAAREMEVLALQDLHDQRQANLDNLSTRIGQARSNLAHGVDPNTGRSLQEAIDKARETIDENPETSQEIQALQNQLSQLSQQLAAAPSLNPDIQREQSRLAGEINAEVAQLAQRQQQIAAKEAAIRQREKEKEQQARNLEKQTEELASATDKIVDYVEEKTKDKKTEEAFPKVAEARRNVRALKPQVEEIQELAGEIADKLADEPSWAQRDRADQPFESATLEDLTSLDDHLADLRALVEGQDLEPDNSGPANKEELSLWQLRDQAEEIRLFSAQLLEKEDGILSGKKKLESAIQIQRDLSINRINEAIREFGQAIGYIAEEPGKAKARQLVTTVVTELKSAPLDETFFKTTPDRIEKLSKFLQTTDTKTKVAATKFDTAITALNQKVKKEHEVASEIRRQRRAIIEFDRHRREATALLDEQSSALKVASTKTLTREHLKNAFLMPIPDLASRLEISAGESVREAAAGRAAEVQVKSSRRYSAAIADRIVRYFGLDPENAQSPQQILAGEQDIKRTQEQSKALEAVAQQADDVKQAMEKMLEAEDAVAKARMALEDAAQERVTLAEQTREKAKEETEQLLRTIDAGEAEKAIEQQAAALAKAAEAAEKEPTLQNTAALVEELKKLQKQVTDLKPATSMEAQARQQALEVLKGISEEMAETEQEAAQELAALAKAEEARKAAAAQLAKESTELAPVVEALRDSSSPAAQSEARPSPEELALQEPAATIQSEA